jgi:hypothetical protein
VSFGNGGSIHSAVGLGREWTNTAWLRNQLGILTISYSLVNTRHLRVLCILLSTVVLLRHGPVGYSLARLLRPAGRLGDVYVDVDSWIDWSIDHSIDQSIDRSINHGLGS